jgi:hypothetical protein
MKATGAGILLLSMLVGPTASGAKEFDPNNALNPPAPVYWCPNRTADKQIATTPDPGCSPLVEKKDDTQSNGKEETDKPLIKIVDIQNEASSFVEQYRKFLECCSTRIDSVEDLDDLHAKAVRILASVQQKGVFNASGSGTGTGAGGRTLGTFSRQWTLSEIVGTVAHARDDLGKLKTRLADIVDSKARIRMLDYESAGRERRRIEEAEEGIEKEFRAKKPPASARTGMEIQNTTIPTRIGGDIESTTLGSSFGADIGSTVSPYSNVTEDLHPRRGQNIQDTNLPTRFGPALGGGNTPASELPISTGFEIGTTQGPTGPSTNPARVGPSIGESSLNSR